jgi:hypothetical protein
VKNLYGERQNVRGCIKRETRTDEAERENMFSGSAENLFEANV